MFSHEYNIVIYCGVGSPGHGKCFVDGLNDTDKSFLSVLMTTVLLSGAATNDLHIFMHTSISNTYISV